MTPEYDINIKEEKKEIYFHLTMNGVMERKREEEYRERGEIVRTIRHLLSLLYLVMSPV